jgi:phospholipid/cholesterol/gamma-HCH transport system substrate-binding protein
MGFCVDAFRFDTGKYVDYTIHFPNISGLSRKGDVKIAGVKVGWVDNVTLGNTMSAQVVVKVLKQYHLYQDAHAIIRQDGILGGHFVEIIPGNSLLPSLLPGATLEKPCIPSASLDELMHQFQKIAAHVEKFSSALERTFARNEDNIDTLLQVGTHIQEMTKRLDTDVLPQFQQGIEKIANAFDRDFNTIANRFDSTCAAIEHFSAQAGNSMQGLNSVVEKVDNGKGFMGKLVNEDNAYQDFKVTIQGFKKYMTKIERIQCIFDTHFEGMLRRAENYEYQDSKGYFDMRIHPNEHSFYVLQVATSEKGFAYRKNIERDYINLEGEPVSFKDNRVVPTTLSDVSSNDLFIEPPNVLIEREQQFERNTIKFGLQFGKIYKDIAFRLGLFEGTAGMALDIDIPFGTDQFRWVSTFELFDVRGFNRRNDKRPHLKWLNRMFVFDNIYMIFGADDFVSKRNASAFLGAGVRFGDDDVKYLLDTMTSAGQASIQSYAGE